MNYSTYIGTYMYIGKLKHMYVVRVVFFLSREYYFIESRECFTHTHTRFLCIVVSASKTNTCVYMVVMRRQAKYNTNIMSAA